MDNSPVASFSLVGGRVDYVGGRRVAVMVYKHGQHFIDLYVLPDDVAGAVANDADAGGPLLRQGLNLIRRRVGGVQTWAVRKNAIRSPLDNFRCFSSFDSADATNG